MDPTSQAACPPAGLAPGPQQPPQGLNPQNNPIQGDNPKHRRDQGSERSEHHAKPKPYQPRRHASSHISEAYSLSGMGGDLSPHLTLIRD